MTKLMKSAVLTASVLFTAVAVAGIFSIKEVNDTVVEFLKPFNNNITKAQIVFTDLDINNERVIKFGVNGLLSKIGKNNELEFSVPRFEYTNDGASKPSLSAAVLLKLDLVKAFSQKYINDMAPELADWLHDVSQDFAKEYGEAIIVESQVDELLKDDAGDVMSMKLHFNATIDLSKLPETMPVANVLFENLNLNISVSRTTGSLGGQVNLNPKYKGFAKDQRGFKEFIESLINKDEKTYRELAEMAEWVDKLAEWLANKSPDQD